MAEIKFFKALSIAAIFLTGCASTIDSISGVGNITNSISEFDGAKIIELSQSHNYSPGKLPRTKFGAKWESSTPDVVYLRLIYNSDSYSSNSYTSFNEIQVNINGEVRNFKVSSKNYHNNSSYNRSANAIYTESKALVSLDKSYLEKMVAANDCRIRVITFDGYEDITFSVDKVGASESSRVKLRAFLDEVEQSI